MRRIVLTLTVLLLGLVVPGASALTSGPPAGLSANGRLLWQFEALLHDVFGNRAPYASSASYDANFACAGSSCFPHASWDPYAYSFAHARGSSFRLKSRHFPAGAFGNYPVPLRINGLYIACDALRRPSSPTSAARPASRSRANLPHLERPVRQGATGIYAATG
jgi:hypothetical protein